MNFYGPSEASVTTLLNDTITTETHPRNIGNSVGCNTWIVDASDHKRLAPIGTTGELLLSGPVLARGYLHDIGKTNDAFIGTQPWSQEPRRLYKTGDLVHYNSDGSLTYVGRKDDSQIKIRGQRVELGEIEHHLQLVIPEIRSVAVDMLEQSSKGRTLAAFLHLSVTPTDSIMSTITQKMELTLGESLPSFMIPNAVVFIPTLPLTLAGKVDRRRLREIGQKSLATKTAIFLGDTTSNIQPPSTDLENQMQALWAEVLNIPARSIGVTAPFFSIGGDSITAIQVVGQSRSLGLSLTTYDVLQQKTIANICKIIESKSLATVQIQHDEVKPGKNFELSPIQREHFLLMPRGNNRYQQSFLLRLVHLKPVAEIRNAVEKVVGAHAMLRSRFTRCANGEWAQMILDPSSDSFCFQAVPSTSVDQIREDMDRKIDIEAGPVFAVGVVDYEESRVLYLTAHHLVVDQVSWRVMLYELEDILMNQSTSIARENLSFPSWSRQQAVYSKSILSKQKILVFDVPKANLAYWGIENVHNTYEEAISTNFSLDKTTSASLLGNCNDPLRTEPVEIFLAAVFHSFNASFPDREPPALFSEGHGREPWDDSLDLSRTVGWFTTMFPLAVKSVSNIIELIIRIKDARRSIPNRGWSYFTAHHLNDHSNKPLDAEIVFNYLGHYQQLERKDAPFELMPVETPAFSRPGSNVRRPSPFEISVIAQKGQIRFDFLFDRRIQHQDRIHQWIEQCRCSLEEAASILPTLKARYTLSDFPLLPSNLIDFDVILFEIFPQLPSDIEDIYPCTAMQRKMQQSQTKDSGCYEATTIWKISPISDTNFVDIPRLQSAWQMLVDGNSILRTCVIDLHGQSFQIVLQSYQADVVVLDGIDQCSNPTMFDEVSKVSRQVRPMHRMTLSPQASGVVLCKLEMSHTLMDGAALSVLLQQLASAYELPLHPGQTDVILYKDYIQHLQTSDRTDALHYWSNYLAAARSCTFPLTDLASTFGSSNSINVDLATLQDSLHPFCKIQGITISTLLHTIWSLVLRLYTQQSSISFGYLVSGRDIPLSGIQSLIGPVFNLLPCHVSLGEDMTLHGALELLHADNVKSVQYNDFSLPETSEGEGLFNTLVNFRKYATSESADVGASSEASIMFEPVDGYDPFEVSPLHISLEHISRILRITITVLKMALTRWNIVRHRRRYSRTRP